MFIDSSLTSLKLRIIHVAKQKIINSATAFFGKYYQPWFVDLGNNTDIFILANYTDIVVYYAWSH
jgi:hypothetical protein